MGGPGGFLLETRLETPFGKPDPGSSRLVPGAGVRQERRTPVESDTVLRIDRENQVGER
jgi:hypothetical protein